MAHEKTPTEETAPVKTAKEMTDREKAEYISENGASAWIEKFRREGLTN